MENTSEIPTRGQIKAQRNNGKSLLYISSENGIGSKLSFEIREYEYVYADMTTLSAYCYIL